MTERQTQISNYTKLLRKSTTTQAVEVVETTTNNTVPVVIPVDNDESEEGETVETEPEPEPTQQSTTQAPEEEPKGMLAKAKVNLRCPFQHYSNFRQKSWLSSCSSSSSKPLLAISC